MRTSSCVWQVESGFESPLKISEVTFRSWSGAAAQLGVGCPGVTTHRFDGPNKLAVGSNASTLASGPGCFAAGPDQSSGTAPSGVAIAFFRPGITGPDWDGVAGPVCESGERGDEADSATIKRAKKGDKAKTSHARNDEIADWPEDACEVLL